MIKRFRTTFHNIIDGEIVQSYLIGISDYDENHNVLHSITMDENEDPLITEVYEYDNNSMIESRVIDHQLNTEFKETFKYENDLIIEHMEYFSEDDYFRSVNVYDDQENILSIIKTDQNNALVNKCIMEKSSDGYIQRNYDENNALLDELTVIKDSRGNEISAKWIDLHNDPSIDIKNVYEYNSLGFIIVDKYFEGDREISITTNKYDSNGNIIESRYSVPIEEYISYVYREYNDQNRLLLEEKYENSILFYKEQNKYNADGDLIEMLVEKIEDLRDDFIVTNKYITDIELIPST